eukprot:Pgem_evm1s2592
MFLGRGICLGVKIGHTGLTAEQVVANVMSGLEQIVEHIPAKWKSIQSINIKSTNSIALPIYNSDPFEFKLVKDKKEEESTEKREIPTTTTTNTNTTTTTKKSKSAKMKRSAVGEKSAKKLKKEARMVEA